ncbi:MAG: pyruvate kinase [Planctomycetaceae bacterium]
MPAYREPLLTKTKIVATIGPSSKDRKTLGELIRAGVDVFRLNFAHGTYAEKAEVVKSVRELSLELGHPVGILGDLSGPKIRLGQLPESGIQTQSDETYFFIRGEQSNSDRELTSSYAGLVDDLRIDNRILLADGTVAMRVVAKGADRVECVVEQPGRLLSRQGINLPGSRLNIASLTEKDLEDLKWGLSVGIDFVGLSFVRCAADIRLLRSHIQAARPQQSPFIVAKIEKPEALDDLSNILDETDMAMVARGDLGVEVDIVRVPALQKRIIAACNQHRVPVITATQMLESMIDHDLPTRAEATDVANAVLDGTDAVMLSGETAMGRHPVRVVSTMSRIIREAEALLVSRKNLPLGTSTRSIATELTEAVTLGAIHAAERIKASLLVFFTASGAAATAVSELRSTVPLLAITDSQQTSQRLTLTWGVHSIVTDICRRPVAEVAEFIKKWGQENGILNRGDRFVLVTTTDWSHHGKDTMLVSTIS